MPQAATSFSPFELLYKRRPSSLLDVVAREAWESQPSPHHSIIEHVETMQHRMRRVRPLVREHLQHAQQAQATIYNRGARVRTFQVGEWVLKLVPTTKCKFLARWKGPYEVVGGELYRPPARVAEAHPNLPCQSIKSLAEIRGTSHSRAQCPDMPHADTRGPAGETTCPKPKARP